MKTIIEIGTVAPGMADIRFDDGTSIAVSRDIVNRYGLKVSHNVDEKVLDKLINEGDGAKCYEAALRYIEFRIRSENELRRHLSSKHIYSTASIEHTIQRLKRSKLLDDKAFAEAWVNDRIKFRPKSRLMLQRELIQKGVDAGDIDEAVSDVDDASGAYQAGIKKARLLHTINHLEFAKRLSAYLARRGYSGEVVRSVVNRLWQEITEK